MQNNVSYNFDGLITFIPGIIVIGIDVGTARSNNYTSLLLINLLPIPIYLVFNISFPCMIIFNHFIQNVAPSNIF